MTLVVLLSCSCGTSLFCKNFNVPRARPTGSQKARRRNTNYLRKEERANSFEDTTTDRPICRTIPMKLQMLRRGPADLRTFAVLGACPRSKPSKEIHAVLPLKATSSSFFAERNLFKRFLHATLPSPALSRFLYSNTFAIPFFAFSCIPVHSSCPNDWYNA